MADRPAAGWRIHAAALVCYTLLALLVTYPLALHVRTSIAANQFGAVDGFLGVWNTWWAAQAISRASDPFISPLLFYPDGIDLFWQTLSLPQTLLVAPITLLVGPLPAYNLLILASFVLGGYCAFLFARSITGHTPGALLAGAIYALAPFHMQKVVDAQLEVAAIQWVPLCLLALHIYLERRRWPWAILSGGMLLLVGLGTWYYGLFCLIYAGMAAGLWALYESTWRARFIRLAQGLAPIGVWLAVMTPRIRSLQQTGDSLLGDARAFNEASSADLVAFFLPNPLHPLWGEAISNWYVAMHPNAMLWNVSVGLVGLLLALAGLRLVGRREWRWAVLLGVTLLLAMGEHLQAFGIETGLPLPYALLAPLPGIRSSHRPNHIVVISILLVGLLAAWGFQALMQRMRAGRRAEWLLAGVSMLLVLAVDGWAGPLPMVSLTIPPYYATMPPSDGGAILPVPVNLNIARSENLWYQTAHGWPIVGGFVGREPPYPLGRYGPGVRELRQGRREPVDIISPAWPQLARDTLAAYNVRYIIFHPDLMKQTLGPMRELIGELGLRPTYSDERTEVYPVPPQSPRALVYLGPGWGEVERDGSRRWRWMAERATLYLVNPYDQPHAITLELSMESYQRDRPLTFTIDTGPAFTLDVTRAATTRQIRLLLEPGTHMVYLTAPADPRPGRAGQAVSISFLNIQVRD